MNVKAARHCNDELVQTFVSMFPPVRPTRYIVEVIDTFNIKRHVVVTFDEGQVAPYIRDFREIDDPAIFEWHLWPPIIGRAGTK